MNNERMELHRRQFFQSSSLGLGTAALAELLGSDAHEFKTFAEKAKRVIYLFMHGGPSQIDLLDPKPELRRIRGKELPSSVRNNQRLTGMTANQGSFPVASSQFKFKQHGQSGQWISELLPHLSRHADDLCVVNSMHTEAINHDPAVTYLQTGHQQPGRPSLGSWVSYGLGSESENLPAFLVLLSHGSAARPDDPLHSRLWGSGFLPSNYQGVSLRSGRDPVPYLTDPVGLDRTARRKMLNRLSELNAERFNSIGDPEITTRISQFELAFRMQSSVPDVVDFSSESKSTLESYGADVRTPGSFATNCLLARKLVERGVRFVQLYHRGWDQHYNLPSDLRLQARDVDQPCAALIRDLKQRGMLDDTLVIWGGEFGRTVYGQGKLEAENYGRDHHGRCFSIWLAGGGIRPGMTLGKTDEYSYNVIERPVHVHDLNATILRCLGIDHARLTYRHKGRQFRITDVHGDAVNEILL